MTIRPNRIVDQVSHYLREQVFQGTLRAGDRLVEKKIAEQLGTGQNAVREALIELSSRGFVHRTANRGTYVMDLSLEEARKISWLRCELELLALDLVLENIRNQASPWSGLEAVLHRMEEAYSRGDSAAQREAWRRDSNAIGVVRTGDGPRSPFARALRGRSRAQATRPARHRSSSQSAHCCVTSVAVR